jgi:hypothetical protein
MLAENCQLEGLEKIGSHEGLPLFFVIKIYVIEQLIPAGTSIGTWVGLAVRAPPKSKILTQFVLFCNCRVVTWQHLLEHCTNGSDMMILRLLVER